MEISKICSPCLKLVLGTASTALRVLEISFAVFLLLSVSSRIPSALQVSLNFFLRLIDFVASPAFAFCICNAIIAAIIAKASGSATGDDVVEGSCNKTIEIGDQEELRGKIVLRGEDKIAGESMNVVTFCEEKESESNEASTVPDFDEHRYNDEDELKRRVDDFIARELRFRREESLAIVLPSY